MAARENSTALIRFGCLFSLSASARSGKNQWHTDDSGCFIQNAITSEYADMALLVAEHAQSVTSVIHSNNAESLMSLFEATDALRRPERFIA